MRAKVSPLSAGPDALHLYNTTGEEEEEGGRVKKAGQRSGQILNFGHRREKKARVRFSFDLHLQPVIGGSVFERFSSKSPWSSLLKRVEGTDGQSSESLGMA